MSLNVLSIQSSLFGHQGASSQLSQSVLDELAAHGHKINLTERNVSEQSLPHFDATVLAEISEGNAKLADQLIAEVQQSDVIIIGAPMYNFAIPSQLKTWFDYIARAGVTFRYTSNGPEGLLKNKKVYVLHSRGGIHRNTAQDTIEPFLNTVLGFVGLNDVTHIFAEGLSMSEHKNSSLTQAKQDITQLVRSQFGNQEVFA